MSVDITNSFLSVLGSSESSYYRWTKVGGVYDSDNVSRKECKLSNNGEIYQPNLGDDTAYLYIRPFDSASSNNDNLLNNFSISGDPMIVTMKYGGFELEGFVSLLSHVSPNGNCFD